MYLDNNGKPLDEGMCDLYSLMYCSENARKNRNLQNVDKETFTGCRWAHLYSCFVLLLSNLNNFKLNS